MRAAEGVQTVFIGRGAPGAHPWAPARGGIVRGWRKNHHGDTDGLSLDGGVEVRFPPHKAGEIRDVVREGMPVEASGAWRGRHLHAYGIANTDTGAAVEAPKPPGKGPGERSLGHTTRFVTDHALCDVVVLQL